MCAIKLLGCSPRTVVARVYLRAGATVSDKKSLFKQLYHAVNSCTNYLVLGDFKIKNIDWSLPNFPSCGDISGELEQFMLEHNIRQLNTEPSRGSNTLYLVLVSPSLSDSEMHLLPPFADHIRQIVQVKFTANPSE